MRTLPRTSFLESVAQIGEITYLGVFLGHSFSPEMLSAICQVSIVCCRVPQIWPFGVRT